MKNRGLKIPTLFLFFAINSICIAAEAPPPSLSAPAIDHILLEVKDLDRSIRFYRDFVGLKLKKRSGDFVTLEAANVGVYLWANHWKWSPPAPSPIGLRPPSGMYPHFAIRDVKGLVARLRQAGYKIVADAKDYNYGTEAFVADPDGFVWSLISSE